MKRQRTVTQMRKKGKPPENQLSKEEILSLQEIDFGSKRGFNSIISKNVTTPKNYKNEKTENYNSDEGEMKNPRKTAK